MVELPVKNPYCHELSVAADEMDVQGRVANFAVVRWISDAAVAHSGALGWPHSRYVELGGFFVVRRHEIDYLASSEVGDAVAVYTWPSSIDRISAERSYLVVRNGEQNVARALTVWTFVDAVTGRPRRIPPELAATFDPARFA